MKKQSPWSWLLVAALLAGCGGAGSGNTTADSAPTGSPDVDSSTTSREITWSMTLDGDVSASGEGDFATCCSVLTGYWYDRTPEEDADDVIFVIPGGPLGNLDSLVPGTYTLGTGSFFFPGVARCVSFLGSITVEITKGSPNAEGTFAVPEARCLEPDDTDVVVDEAATINGQFKLRR